MSQSDTHAVHGDHSHGHDDHDHDDHDGHAPSTIRGYLTGFILSVALTAIPFWLVMGKVIDSPVATTWVILGFAVVQIFVHMIYFLHMNAKSENGWSLLALIFTLVLVVIALAGSMWVMHHMNVNMMPTMSPADTRNMP